MGLRDCVGSVQHPRVRPRVERGGGGAYPLSMASVNGPADLKLPPTAGGDPNGSSPLGGGPYSIARGGVINAPGSQGVGGPQTLSWNRGPDLPPVQVLLNRSATAPQNTPTTPNPAPSPLPPAVRGVRVGGEPVGGSAGAPATGTVGGAPVGGRSLGFTGSASFLGRLALGSVGAGKPLGNPTGATGGPTGGSPLGGSGSTPQTPGGTPDLPPGFASGRANGNGFGLFRAHGHHGNRGHGGHHGGHGHHGGGLGRGFAGSGSVPPAVQLGVGTPPAANGGVRSVAQGTSPGPLSSTLAAAIAAAGSSSTLGNAANVSRSFSTLPTNPAPGNRVSGELVNGSQTQASTVNGSSFAVKPNAIATTSATLPVNPPPGSRVNGESVSVNQPILTTVTRPAPAQVGSGQIPVTLHTAHPGSLAVVFHDAIRQSDSSHAVTQAFHALNSTHTLALVRSPTEGHSPAGLTGSLNRDEAVRLVTSISQAVNARQMQPEDVLRAFGLMNLNMLGADWMMFGADELMALLLMGEQQRASGLMEMLAAALLQNAGRQTNDDPNTALLQMMAAIQLASATQDPDIWARLFATQADPLQRQQFLQQLAAASAETRLAGRHDQADPLAQVIKAVAARDGSSRVEAHAPSFDQLRAELMSFLGTQPAAFFIIDGPNGKQFHSQRMEAVLQCIIQHLLRELGGRTRDLWRLKRRYSDSVELLSSLLDLIGEDEDDAHGNPRRQAHDTDDDDEADDSSTMVEVGYRYMFSVVNEAETGKTQHFMWREIEGDPTVILPARFADASPLAREMDALRSVSLRDATLSCTEPPHTDREWLQELLNPSDAAYALGAVAAGQHIMTRHWYSRMWAHDLVERTAHRKVSGMFDFQQSYRTVNNALTDMRGIVGDVPWPREPLDMRVDLVRMLANSADDWVRKQASDLLQSLTAQANQLPRGTQVDTAYASPVISEKLHTPQLRNFAIYFLSQYYFRVARESGTRSAVTLAA